MKKIAKKLLCLLLAAAMLLPAAALLRPAGVIPVSAGGGGTFKAGDIIKFGGYPQTRINDTETKTALNNLAKKAAWTSYRYTTGKNTPGSETESDWMKYCDVEYNGAKYRGVTFSQYRPYKTNTYSPSSTSLPQQAANGYGTLNYNYWFKWESLTWRVLDPDTGLVVCNSIIDSQPFLIDTSVGNTGNSYIDSSIRTWLNDDFMSAAFSGTELEKIVATKLTANAADQIFLLSKDEFNNPAYGISGGLSAMSTNYAGIQGISGKDVTVLSNGVYSTVFNSTWWMRSPGKDAVKGVAVGFVKNPDTNDWYFEYDVSSTDIGVRPAFCFKAEIVESVNPNGHVHLWGEWQQEYGNLQRHVRVCGYNPDHKEYAEHEWGEYIYTKMPTCTSWGIGAHACTVCGFEIVESVPTDPENHVKKYEVTTPATCKTEGERKVTCALCGKDLGTETVPVDPDAHKWDLGTDLYNGTTKYTCTLCGATKIVGTYVQNDTFTFGAYPQSRVTNNNVIKALNDLADAAQWYSYGYYSGLNDNYGSMSSGDFMKYCDVSYNGARYRGVKMTQYRPKRTTLAATAENSGIDEMGYELNVNYWFKWEPLTWRVLRTPTPDETEWNSNIVICEQIIDAQAFSNTVYRNPQGTSYYGYYFTDKTYKNSLVDYSASSLRHWLLNDFYNTAFTQQEREGIDYTDLETGYFAGSSSPLKTVATADKIYVLSRDQALSPSLFGMGASSASSLASRMARATDYAKLQGGLEVYPNSGESDWLLRYGSDTNVGAVRYGGNVGGVTAYNVSGVRPVFRFKDDIIVPDANSTGGDGIYAADAELTHIWDKGVEITPATCSTEGVSAYTCIICGESITQSTPMAAHSWNTWVKCSDTQHSRTCKNNAEHVQYGDHTWNSGVVTKNPSCTLEGVTTYTCSVCKGTKTEPIERIPHEWLNWTQFDEELHMRACALDVSENHREYEPHTWDNGVVSKPATTATEGEKKYTCTVCEGTKTEPIPMLPSSITVEGGTASVASATKGTEVTVTASAPPAGKVFLKWEVVKGGVTLADETGATTTFVMGSAAVQIRATYKDLPAGEHSVTVINGTASPAAAAKGATVTITAASAPAGKAFDKWEVVKGGITLADAAKATTTFVMGDADVEVKAAYKDLAPATHSVTVTDGTATPAAAAKGTTVTVTANAAPAGKAFDKWEVVKGGITLADAAKATTTFVMVDADVELKAIYKSAGLPEFLLGDVDGDGEITAADARDALRASVKIENFAEGSRAFLAADADKDNVLTAGDARLILRRSVGIKTDKDWNGGKA